MPLACPRCGTGNTDDSRYCRSCATPLPGSSGPGRGASPPPGDAGETPAPLTGDLAPGSIFAGRYRIVEELGRGGMGRVVRALDTRTNEQVAIKVIRADIEADPQAVKRFGHELTAARKISHRNVCRVYDLGEEAGRLCITMEYVPGEDLRSVLRMTGRMNPAQVVAIGLQICDGLEEAHRVGVVHRDLEALVARPGGDARLGSGYGGIEAADDGRPGAEGAKPTPRETTRRFPSLKRLVLPVAALAALAVVGWFILPSLRKSGGGPAVPKVSGSIAVIGFENQTGDAKYDYLRKVIPNLLITNLENSGLAQVATWERMRDVLRQAGRGADAGLREPAEARDRLAAVTR